MRPPKFWTKTRSHPAALLLRPLGSVYGAVTAARMDRPGTRAPCPVLCIGNFTLGGAGKTPTAIAVAGMLIERGLRPAFLTRGYGGRLAGPLVVDPDRYAAAEIGDEPLLLARHATTIVARDRPAGARLCAEQGADVIVMDDGLQNPSLTKDLSFVAVDAAVGLGNGLTVPAGPLRAPLARQWRHVAGVVLIGDGNAGDEVERTARERGIAVHRARLVPMRPKAMAGRRVLAFAGIGRPEKFFASLRAAGADIVARRTFDDHHVYREAELTELTAAAKRLNADLVTTEKDRVRLPSDIAGRVAVLKVALRFENDVALKAQLAAFAEART